MKELSDKISEMIIEIIADKIKKNLTINDLGLVVDGKESFYQSDVYLELKISSSTRHKPDMTVEERFKRDSVAMAKAILEVKE